MGYVVRVEPKAFDRLPALPSGVIDLLEKALGELAEDPLNRSRKACFPYPEDGAMLHFCDFECEGTHYYFAVSYFFDEDEKTLHVYDVGFTQQPQ